MVSVHRPSLVGLVHVNAKNKNRVIHILRSSFRFRSQKLRVNVNKDICGSFHTKLVGTPCIKVRLVHVDAKN